MALLETLYGPNSVTTQTPGIALPALPSPKAVDLSPLAALFFARRREQEQARRPQINQIQSRALAPQAEQSPFGGRGGIEEEARNAALRDQILQAQIASQPAPRRMMHGPGVTPGYVMDPLAMNAAQRQAFLPKEAGLDATPTPDDVIRVARMTGRAPNPYSDESRALADSWGMG